MAKPHPVDVHVGARARARRLDLGYSQDRLAKAMGVTFQQIQKYERGSNRIVSSRLFDLARALDVPIEFFFAEMPEAQARGGRLAVNEDAPSFSHDLIAQQDTQKLVRAYYGISNRRTRKRLLDLIKSVGLSIR